MALIYLSRSFADFVVGTAILLFTLQAALGQFKCNPPRESNGPLPPVLPEIYHMAYELNDLTHGSSQFFEVWYDWFGQRSKVEMKTQTDDVTILSFYDKNAAYMYSEPKSGNDEMEDEAEDISCTFLTLKGNVGNNPVPFYDPERKPLTMVDIYEALLYGGRYRYQFIGKAADETSRFVWTNRFSSCIVDRVSGSRLNVTYHWTIESPDSSVDETMPVMCELVREDPRTKNQTHHIISIVRFDRDPVMTDELFQVPRHMHCKDDPAVVDDDELPALHPSFSWREEIVRYDTHSNGKAAGSIAWENYREVWVSHYLDLARIDWTPSADEEAGSFFGLFAGKPISVIADVSHNTMFITNQITGQCSVEPLTVEFDLVRRNSTTSLQNAFALKAPKELLGLTGPHVNKSQISLLYNERGNRVIVLSSSDDETNPDTIHEATFRYDREQAYESHSNFPWVPVSQLTRSIENEADTSSGVIHKVRQISYFYYQSDVNPIERFVSPECVALHPGRLFMLSFSADNASVVLERKTKFLNNVRESLFHWANLGSIMRIQDFDVFKFENMLNCTFTIIDLPDYSNQTKTTIEEAKTALADAINDVDEVHIKIRLPSLDNDEVSPLADSFYEITFEQRTNSDKRSTPSREVLRRSIREVPPNFSDPDNDTGYTNQTLIGICIGFFVLGLVVGFVSIRVWRPSVAPCDDVVRLTDLQESSTELTSVRPKTTPQVLDQAGPSGWSSGH